MPIGNIRLHTSVRMLLKQVTHNNMHVPQIAGLAVPTAVAMVKWFQIIMYVKEPSVAVGRLAFTATTSSNADVMVSRPVVAHVVETFHMEQHGRAFLY